VKAATYITKDGDTVDYVAWRHYGSTAGGVVEAVLSANKDLAVYGPVLPTGIRVTLPEIKQPSKQGVQLWM
jgi:phage tail protein X